MSSDMRCDGWRHRKPDVGADSRKPSVRPVGQILVANEQPVWMVATIHSYDMVENTPEKRGLIDDRAGSASKRPDVGRERCERTVEQAGLLEIAEGVGPMEALETTRECGRVADQDDDAHIERLGQPWCGEQRERVFEKGPRRCTAERAVARCMQCKPRHVARPANR
jgi:hypothetical protein